MGLEELSGCVQGWVRCWRFAGAKKGAPRATDDAGDHAVFFIRFMRLLHTFISRLHHLTTQFSGGIRFSPRSSRRPLKFDRAGRFVPQLGRTSPVLCFGFRDAAGDGADYAARVR